MIGVCLCVAARWEDGEVARTCDTLNNSPCIRQKRLRVYIQNVPVCTGTTRTCVSTCARGAGTHGDVLNGHTGERGRRSPSILLTTSKETRGSYTFFSLRIDREQHVPDSSNHSLLPDKAVQFQQS